MPAELGGLEFPSAASSAAGELAVAWVGDGDRRAGEPACGIAAQTFKRLAGRRGPAGGAVSP